MSERISLQHNESYWLLDDTLRAAYAQISPDSFSRYPHYTALTEAIARYASVPADHILITNGSDAAVQLIAEEESARGGRGLLPVPTFYGYERIFRRVGLPHDCIVYTEHDGAFIFPLESTIAALRSGSYSALFICQPNNPLGAGVAQSEINTLITVAVECQVRIVIDEAYFEFLGSTSIARISDGHVVILRTLSKGFGLAGARVGYLCADPAYIRTLGGLMLPWSVAHPSVEIALTALAHSAPIAELIAQVIHERDIFVSELAQVATIQVYPSCTNFVLVRVPDAARIATGMQEDGIDVAQCGRMSEDPAAQELLRETVRMAVPAPHHRDQVITSLKRGLDKGTATVL